MNPVEMALQTWRDEKTRYHKQIHLVIAELSKSVHLIPSPEFETKQEELKETLKYHYNHQDDENYHEVYVHHIAGVTNLSLMELSNRLVEHLGGTVNFWQNKIYDIATYVNYHPELSIWEVNRYYQSYMGLSPEFANHLRKKRSLAKNYLFWLTSICKLIDKSKANQQQLIKIDENYKKLKKAEEIYYAFVEQIEEVSHSQPAISTKGKKNAKNTLFMFLKKKEDKTNTLINYNFKVIKQQNDQQSKLLRGKDYEQFDEVFKKLMKQTRSQRQSSYSDTSQSMFPASNSKQTNIPIEQLRSQLKNAFKREAEQKDAGRMPQNTYIWSKEYYFTFWGYPVKPIAQMDYISPYQQYPEIIYDIDSEQEFDQLNAQDLSHADELSEQLSDSDGGSFVVGDDYRSDEQQEKETLKVNQKIYQKQSWLKEGDQLKQFQMICLFPEESHPLCIEQDQLNLDEQFIDKINGKGRNEIMSMFQAQKKDVSKRRIDCLLKNNFKKAKNKSKQVIYLRNDQPVNIQKNAEIFSDPQTTTGQPLQISISYASKPRKSQDKVKINETILQESPYRSK